MTAQQRSQSRELIAQAALQWCVENLAAGARIACYEPLPTEPGSAALLYALTEAGFEVIVPITLADFDLDWQLHASGATLGVDGIVGAGLVLVPAFAVDRRGHRLGRGGGSYDRALLRVRPGVTIAAVLFEGEVLPAVPVHAWDVAVTAVLTPGGFLALNQAQMTLNQGQAPATG